MKRTILLAPLAMALVAVGCDDAQISSGASRAAYRMDHDTSDYGSRYDNSDSGRRILDLLRRARERRREEWRDHNERRWGGRPGWGGRRDRDHGWNRQPEWRHGRNDWSRGPRDDWRRGPGHDWGRGRDHHGGGRDWNRQPDWRHGGERNWGGGRGLMAVAALEPVADQAPALSREYLAAAAHVGKALGMSSSSATKLMDALDRAVVGDFLGLRALGLTPEGIKAAAANRGRLSAGELDSLSRRLGVSQQKADRLIQALLK